MSKVFLLHRIQGDQTILIKLKAFLNFITQKVSIKLYFTKFTFFVVVKLEYLQNINKFKKSY